MTGSSRRPPAPPPPDWNNLPLLINGAATGCRIEPIKVLWEAPGRVRPARSLCVALCARARARASVSARNLSERNLSERNLSERNLSERSLSERNLSVSPPKREPMLPAARRSGSVWGHSALGRFPGPTPVRVTTRTACLSRNSCPSRDSDPALGDRSRGPTHYDSDRQSESRAREGTPSRVLASPRAGRARRAAGRV